MSAEPHLTPDDYDKRLTSCRLCGSKNLRPYDRDFRGNCIDRCAGCGVKFMNPQYSQAYLDCFYSSYISLHDEPTKEKPVSMRMRRDVREASKRRCLQLVSRFVEPGRLLSVGCGDGVELGVAKELGWQVEGYDIDPVTTAEVAKEYGVVVHSGSFGEIPVAPGTFDAVFLDQVIEHPKNPGDYLRKIHELLRPGGVLFLGLPNIGSFANRFKTLMGQLGLRKKRGKHYASKHHIFYYTPSVMRSLLERHYGFEVLLMRGSLKPQKKVLTPVLSRWFPNADSGFLLIARKPIPTLAAP